MDKIKILYSFKLKEYLQSKSFVVSFVFFIVAIILVSYSSFENYKLTNDLAKKYQEQDRLSWESNPDKHPHRMAHYGSFAIKQLDPLCLFDSGINSYVGSIVYLEAHKQNTANFVPSNSVTKSGFMDISLSNLLKIVLPLLLIIIGYRSIAYDKEKGVLKLLLVQNVSVRQVYWANFLALKTVSLLFVIPVFLALYLMQILNEQVANISLLRLSLLLITYVIYLAIVSLLIMNVSFFSKNATHSLLKLTAIWILFILVLPKSFYAFIESSYRVPSKIEVETLLTEKMSKIGDSHNPEDLYFKRLKDSVLRVNKVDSVEKLTFNYAGFVMKEAEKIYAKIYKEEIDKCNDVIIKQNSLFTKLGVVDPFIALQDVSEKLCDSDFDSHLNFQSQAEDYRYYLAQKMNDLQIKYISNKKLSPTDKPYAIDKKHWHDLERFHFKYRKENILVQQALFTFSVLVIWFAILFIRSFYLKEIKL